MEQNKYYTPEIGDLFVGYECEIWWNQNYLPENEWCEVRALKGSTEDFDLYDFTSRVGKKEIRTPFLTKEQIEKEGWIQGKLPWQFFNGDLYLVVTKGKDFENIGTNQELTINSQMNEDTIYRGQCPSINEFRKINKLLGIK